MSAQPRTRHRRPDGTPLYTNLLQGQTSPYLLQHVHNPVNWRPWGEEAFAEARRRDVPVFLSIGYSTCHWCHVMEEESFEDEDIANVINSHYVAVKVDREERPDVDALYMTAVQALTGHGGWPMSVWLTPDDKKPFFAGTYFPARDGDRGTRTGFRTILLRLSEAWTQERAKVTGSADAITAELLPMLRPPAPADRPGLQVVDDVVAFVSSRFDAAYGGLEPAPKFPSSLPIRLLLQHSALTGSTKSREMALLTLRKMIDGGLHDHAGGGFHRYSVDDKWLVPHFEKMLYDNALLVPALLEAWQLTGDELFADAARDTLGWMQREMSQGPPGGAGGFFSATDADSLTPSGEREEGYFFTWTLDELSSELGPEDAAFVSVAFDVTPGGNFEGRSILWRKQPVEAAAKRLGVSVSEIHEATKRSLPRLLNARNERPAPLRDDKVLCAWNGLAITAFAAAAFAFDDAALKARATAALDFVLEKLADPREPGRLRRSWKDGTQGPPGVLDDHAFVCRACLDVFSLTGDARWLDAARALDGVLARHFEDADNGGFFLSADDGEALLAREKPDRDGAEPCGNSIHAENLVRLALLTDDDAFRARAEKTFRSCGQILAKHPHALSEMVRALVLLERAKEIVVVTPKGGIDDDGRALLALVRKRYLPARVVVVVEEGSALSTLLPLARDRPARKGKTTVYVCAHGVCGLPVTDARSLLAQLG
ncbi:MAG: thioredoxin domain-containing protein [Deltaproteobacteria bacterium]|nr:thioredoxin domain-containing protein [Deltaproteobacteria bacterium]